MKRYIIDTSFILAAYLDNRVDVEERIIAILKEVEKKKAALYVPSLFFFEVANVLRYALQDTDKAERILGVIVDIPWNVYPLTKGDYLSIIRMAKRQDTSVYDTTYHYFAIYIDGIFLTCDTKYMKKAEKMNIEVM